VTVSDIPLDRIDAAPSNSNRMDEPMRRRLFASLGRYGLVQPLVVRRRGERYETIAGAQRLAALQVQGAPTAPCVVLDDLDDADARLLSVALNRIGGIDDVNLLGDLAREMLAALPQEAITAVLPHSLDHLQALASLGDLAQALPAASQTTTAAPASQAASWERIRGEGFDRISFALAMDERQAVEEAVALALRLVPETDADAPNRRGVALAFICTS
jgi:ParB-like chromosome segregation protein Spo0J